MSMIKYGITQEDEDEAVKPAQLDLVFKEVAHMTPAQVRAWLANQRLSAKEREIIQSARKSVLESACPDPTSTSK